MVIAVVVLMVMMLAAATASQARPPWVQLPRAVHRIAKMIEGNPVPRPFVSVVVFELVVVPVDLPAVEAVAVMAMVAVMTIAPAIVVRPVVVVPAAVMLVP
jgi:hypothetical protein